MKKTILSVAAIVALTGLLVWSCGPNAKEKKKQAVVSAEMEAAQGLADKEAAGYMTPKKESETSSNPYVSSSAAVENKKDTVHKFVRTAELKFRVKNVERSTYAIEDIVAKHNGFVTYTNLHSDIQFINKQSISRDSVLEATRFTVINDMIIRVPNTQLDTTLKEIALLIDHLDYRIIKAEDMALNLLENQLTQSRISRNEGRMERAIENRGKKLGETSDAEEALLNRQEQADNAKIANMKIRDQINFSTVNIAIYQRQTIKREIIADDSNLDSYEPGFASRIWGSIKAGWKVFEEIFVFVVRLWGVLLLIVLAYLLYKRFRSK